MRKERSVRVAWPRYAPHQERRAKQALERLERWREQHQEPHELRLRALLKPQLDAWR